MLLGYSGRGPFPDASSGRLAAVKPRAGVMTLDVGIASIDGDSGGVYVNIGGYPLGINQASFSLGKHAVGLSVEEIEKVWESLKAGAELNRNSAWWHDSWETARPPAGPP